MTCESATAERIPNQHPLPPPFPAVQPQGAKITTKLYLHEKRRKKSIPPTGWGTLHPGWGACLVLRTWASSSTGQQRHLVSKRHYKVDDKRWQYMYLATLFAAARYLQDTCISRLPMLLLAWLSRNHTADFTCSLQVADEGSPLELPQKKPAA